MLKQSTLAEFTWGFDEYYLLKVNIEGKIKYFEWSDPEYNGDSTITPYEGDPLNYAAPGHRGTYKGIHTIAGFCGPNVTFEGSTLPP